MPAYPTFSEEVSLFMLVMIAAVFITVGISGFLHSRGPLSTKALAIGTAVLLGAVAGAIALGLGTFHAFALFVAPPMAAFVLAPDRDRGQVEAEDRKR